MINIFCIIPCYNAQKTIERCYKSIVHAFLNFNESKEFAYLFIIFINDGSTDKTKLILHNFKSYNSKISINIIDQNNQGAGSARNSGIQLALASFKKTQLDSYVLFVDADDEMHTDFFIDLLPHINSRSIVCGQSGSEIINSNTVTEFSKQDALKALITYYRKEIKSGCVNKIYPLNIWNDIRFPSITYCEDLVTNIAAFSLSKTIKVVHRKTYIVHRDGSSLTSKAFDHSKAEKWLESLLYLSNLDCCNAIKKYIKPLVCEYYLEVIPKASFSIARKYKSLIRKKDLLMVKGNIKTLIKKYAYLLFGWKIYYYLRKND